MFIVCDHVSIAGILLPNPNKSYLDMPEINSDINWTNRKKFILEDS